MNRLIVVRGGGDLATGTIHRLWSAGFPVLILETARPAAIRRQVSLCEAVYDGTATVEGLTAQRIPDLSEMEGVLAAGRVPLLVDPEGSCLNTLHPAVVVDAIIAKRNLGTHRQMAPFTIALGPGFAAGVDVDVVIETCRGHNLGRVITAGTALPNTGRPGNIGGYTMERVLHAPAKGIVHTTCAIGDLVKQGQTIAWIETQEEAVPVKATIPGILRGLIRERYPVTEGFKIADIDPRQEELSNCFTISDKARAIAGSVLEQVCAALCRQAPQS